MSNESIEKEIIDKGLTAPRVTLESILKKVVNKGFHQPEGTTLTICFLTLENGTHVIGESACVSPENFNKELGEKIAFESAVNKVWALEGYLLKEYLTELGKPFVVADKEALLKEEALLDAKLEALHEFVHTEEFNELDEEVQDFIRNQGIAMCDYTQALGSRIKLL